MKRVVDLVNFNADASCLDARRWLEALDGGEDSEMCRWLRLYVDLGKPIVLGLTGATIADLGALNPEALALIRAHRSIFQILVRPFAHDAALLRTAQGFRANLEAGRALAEAELGEVLPAYLPPEFMLTVEQVGLLAEAGIRATFVNASRHPVGQGARIPDRPYRLAGTFGTALTCMPVLGTLTRAFLDAHDSLEARAWNRLIAEAGHDHPVIGWRDGESWLLIPDGLAREARWLETEARDIHRGFLNPPAPADCPDPTALSPTHLRSYPVHSLSAWLKELRMLRFVRQVEAIENRLGSLDDLARGLWLLVINSDILSAVEKDPVPKRMRAFDRPELLVEILLLRSERGFEGAEYLALLERHLAGGDLGWLEREHGPHLVKARARLKALGALAAEPSQVQGAHG